MDTVEFELSGIVSMPEGTDMDAFFFAFIDFMEAQGGTYAGSIKAFDADAEPLG